MQHPNKRVRLFTARYCRFTRWLQVKARAHSAFEAILGAVPASLPCTAELFDSIAELFAPVGRAGADR